MLSIGSDIVISIHSLRMEGDQHALISPTFLEVFQSTPSAWRETLETSLCQILQ